MYITHLFTNIGILIKHAKKIIIFLDKKKLKNKMAEKMLTQKY